MACFVSTLLPALIAVLSCGDVTSPPVRDSSSFVDAVLYITGESDIENVPQSEMELFIDLHETPLPVNTASRAKLASSGLLSSYQIASLLDYISVSGDVMSISELAAIDGFGKEMANALSPFISIESAALPGSSSRDAVPAHNCLAVCSSVKQILPRDGQDASISWSSSVKYRLNGGDRYDAGLSVKRYYDRMITGSAYMAFYGKRHLSQIVVGDVSLRFGQGLALWTGFSMSGLSGVRSFWKRPSGVSPSMAYSGDSSVRGIASEFTVGKLGISAFLLFPGLRDWCEKGVPLNFSMMPGLNISWYNRHGQLSMTAFGIAGNGISDNPDAYLIGNSWTIPVSKLSADARFSVRGAEFFGETSFDAVSLKLAATCGVMCPFGEKWKTAFSARWIPQGYDLEYSSPIRTWSADNGEIGVSAGLSFMNMDLSADFGMQQENHRRQARIVLTCPLKISRKMSLSLRLQERLRTYNVRNRTDFRADLKWTSGCMQTTLRGNILMSKKVSWLTYVDEGYAGRGFAVFLRGTVFMVDNWDDRIYCYERDVPGNFNVPAYYGRGYSVSAMARINKRWTDVRSGNRGGQGDCWRCRVMKAYIRVGWTDMPWHGPGEKATRPSKAEARIQVVYEF